MRSWHNDCYSRTGFVKGTIIIVAVSPETGDDLYNLPTNCTHIVQEVTDEMDCKMSYEYCHTYASRSENITSFNIFP